ncbi:MAG: DDE-type integrase/transposase/recombinase, partial [Myxococcota bacterium]
MHVLLMGLGELLLGGAAVLLWLRHHLRVSADRWARRQRRWRKRFDTVRARLTGRRAFPRWRRWRGGHNRTPTEVEERVCRLAVERKDLGLRGLSVLFARVEGVVLGVTTVRAILIRRRTLLAELEESRKKRRRIRVTRPNVLWGVDLTLVWLWGVVPVWLFGVVDYYGSRLLLLEPVARSAFVVARTLEGLFAAHGAPEAVLSDNGGEFRAEVVEEVLRRFGVRRRFIRP